MKKRIKNKLESLYERYNRREYVHPDPLEFLYDYEDVADREIAGLVASSLAYGRVTQILRSVSSVLDRMGRPSEFLENSPKRSIASAFRGFKHRFTTGSDLSALLWGAKSVIERHGSLRECFMLGLKGSDETVLPALGAFVGRIAEAAGGELAFLLPFPEKGSACKRLNLFLRWMVRRDAVDPGGWDGVPAAKLLVPLDTHMYGITRSLGFTGRKSADIRTALEATEGFRRISPEDPVRYDFALTRPGIRRDPESRELLRSVLQGSI